MPIFGMGESIRTMRIRFGYTQEELSYGICTPATLSKIENGKSAVSRQVYEALVSRMVGKKPVVFACETEKEMQRSTLCKKILLNLEQRELKEAKTAIEQYEKIKEHEKPFCRQFAYYSQAIYLAVTHGNENDRLQKLYLALQETMPNYKELFQLQKKIFFLTYDEIYILSNIGIIYTKQKKTEYAFQIFHYLKLYMEKQKFDVCEAAGVYSMVLGNFAWFLERLGQYEEAAKQCGIGIQICFSIGKYTSLPYLLCINARCHAAVENIKEAKKYKTQAKMLLDITENYRGYGSFREFYEAKEPIYVIT